MTASNARALVAAFAFGIAVNAASVALFLYVKGHGSSIMRDGPRLVLITFFATSALWALTDFITTLIDLNSTTGCQVAIAFASAFDQLARSSLIQGLLWQVNNHLQVSSVEVLLSQGLVFLRFILGAVFVGFQRPQLDTVCVTRTSVLPLGIIIIALDVLLVLGLLARAMLGQRSQWSKKVKYAIAGWGVWTSTSAPMILGLRSIDLTARTAIPAAGLVTLIGILMLVKDSLISHNRNPLTSRSNSPTSREPEMARQVPNRDSLTTRSAYASVQYGGFETETSIAAGPEAQPKPGQLKGGLPLITRPNTGQALTGMGGVPVQGQLFPPMRVMSEPIAPRTDRQAPRLTRKKSNKLAISNPILKDGHELNPLQKIATVDLETAARNEKEKRDMGLVSTEETVSSQSLKDGEAREQRKIRRSQSSLHPPTQTESFASTTSAELSPGIEEIRRRSPGQAPQDFQQNTPLANPRQMPRTSSSKSTTPPPTRPASSMIVELSVASPSQTEAKFPPLSPPSTKPSSEDKADRQKVGENFSKETAIAFARKPLRRQPTLESVTSSKSDPSIALRMSILPRSNSVKLNIRPSRQRPPSVPLEEPSAKAKIPVQMRAKPGLPSNPRAHAVLALKQERGTVNEQAPVFVSDIGNGDHETIDGTPEKNATKTPDPGMMRAPSVVHRPRPIPRKPEVDRAIFPAEGSPNMHEHKRSLSNGSVRGRKSVLNPAWSAERQPPLPQLPKNTGTLSRPQPNNTMSMTWHEKVNMYYREPLTEPGAPTGRTGSQPTSEMPAMPLVHEQKRERVGFGTGLHTADISSEEDMILATLEAPIPPYVTRNVSKFSITTYQSTADGRGPRASRRTMTSFLSDEGVKRKSSPILPSMEYSPSLSSKGEESGDDETTTNWGSVHSPPEAVNMQLTRAVEVPAVPKFTQSPDDDKVVQAKSASEANRGDGKETMTVMLDPSLNRDVRSAQGPRQGSGPRALWHRRVGDVCPTFSEARRTRKQRKAPPPAPLLLSTVPLIIQAEPSPLESPRHVLETINVQLSQLENANVKSNDMEVQRMTLLADLEMEMGVQESQWQQMRHTLVFRDSLSTLEPSPNPESGDAHKTSSAMASSTSLKGLLADRRASRRRQSNAKDELMAVSSHGHNINWQQKLVEAQMEYMGNMPELPGRTSTGMNFLMVSTSSKMQLGSPTPPDTDESGSEYEVDLVLQMDFGSEVGTGGLWRPPRPTTSDVAGATPASLWTPAPKTEAEPQGVSAVESSREFIRSRGRKDQEPLTIESSRLWEKPVSSQRFSIGLWRPATPAATTNANSEAEIPSTIPTRAVMQRPPRRGRRVTMLPDILESPKMLPDRRGTLGIFKFPWGYVSDNATMQPTARMYMSMPGTMSSGGGPVINNGIPEMQTQSQRMVSSHLEEFSQSQSFFDDYEREDEGDNLDDYEADYDCDYSDADDMDIEDQIGHGHGDDEFEDDKDREDDDFDEATLWEIASLLKSDGVPSRDSLFSTLVSGSQDSSSHGQGMPHQEGLRLGNLDGHGDRANLGINAGLGVPSGSGDERRTWSELRDSDGEGGCDGDTDFDIDSSGSDNDEDGGANPSVLEITNGFPSPPRRSDRLLTNRPRATVSSARARQGTPDAVGAASAPAPAAAPGPAPGSAPGPLTGTQAPPLHLDAQPCNWNAPLDAQRALASASDWTEPDSVQSTTRKAEPRLVENVGGSVEEGRHSAQGGGDSVSSPDNETPPWPISAPIARVNHGTPPTKLQGLHHHKRQPVVTKNSLWTPSPVKTPPAKGLAQPDDQAESISLASTQAPAHPYIIESHEVFPSSSLWSLQSSTDNSDNSSNCDAASEQPSLLWNPINCSPTPATSMALWTPTAPIHISPKGLPQPDAAIWDNYQPSVANSLRSSPRKAEAATIESASLWSPAPKIVKGEDVEAPRIGLWTSKKQQLTASPSSMWVQPKPVQKVSYGLSQPEHHIWSSYLPAEEEVLRVKTRESTPASIESTTLWAPPPPRTTMSAGTDSLWSASKISTITTEAESSPAASSLTPSAAANLGLWTRPAPVEDEEPQGLFSLNHKRSEFRSTSLSPAALDMPRKRRAALEPFPDFVFSYLWNESPLWRGPSPVIEEQAEGLFSLGHRRTNYRTTDQPPAALNMLRKPRISNEPLPKLTSNSLWSVPTTKPVEYDWLKLSTTVGHKTASTVSSASDNESLSTVASSIDEDDASSIKSAVAASKQTAKSALWAKSSKPAEVDSVTATSQYTSMWQPSPPSNADSVDTEPEYTVAEADEERSTTFRYRRKSEDEVAPGPMSPSNFFLLSTPETPRDFSAQALWTQDDGEAYTTEDRTWLDESVLRLSRVQMQLS